MKFQKYLKHLINTEKYRLVDLSAKTGINSPDLSKLVRGVRTCGAKTMGQILSGLEEEHRQQALMAWLVDQVPAEYQHLVHIVRSGAVEQRPEPPDIDTVAGSLEVLGVQAEKNEAVRVVLKNLAAAFSGSP